jgi:hypothetical protein
MTLLRPKVNHLTPKNYLEGYLQGLVSVLILMETQKGELSGHDMIESLKAMIHKIRTHQAKPCLLVRRGYSGDP